MKWKGFNWFSGETWGNIHPDKPEVYYDEKMIHIDECDNLHLKTKYQPKVVNGIKSKVACGLITSMDEFWRGEYTIVAKLPRGKNLWPAIWLYGQNQWPPEIDIMEGYSNRFGGYFNIDFKDPFNWWHFESNVHYKGVFGQHKVYGAERIKHGFLPPSGFVEYKLIWTKWNLTFLVNGKVTRVIDLRQFGSQFNEPMRFILNNAIRTDRAIEKKETDFIIKDFKYKKL